MAQKLFRLETKTESSYISPPDEALLAGFVEDYFQKFLDDMNKHNKKFFVEEMDKLDKWEEDQCTGLKTNLKELDDQIKELKKQIRQTVNLPDKLHCGRN